VFTVSDLKSSWWSSAHFRVQNSHSLVTRSRQTGAQPSCIPSDTDWDLHAAAATTSACQYLLLELRPDRTCCQYQTWRLLALVKTLSVHQWGSLSGLALATAENSGKSLDMRLHSQTPAVWWCTVICLYNLLPWEPPQQKLFPAASSGDRRTPPARPHRAPTPPHLTPEDLYK